MIGKLIAGWVVDWLLKAAAAWLTSKLNGRSAAPIEQLPDGHPDAAPSPSKPRPTGPVKQPKYPVDTRPGRFNRETGRFNP